VELTEDEVGLGLAIASRSKPVAAADKDIARCWYGQRAEKKTPQKKRKKTGLYAKRARRGGRRAKKERMREERDRGAPASEADMAWRETTQVRGSRVRRDQGGGPTTEASATPSPTGS